MRFLKMGIVTALLFVGASIFWVVRTTNHKDLLNLPVYATVPPFHLLDQNKMTFDSETFKGHVSVINFIFTSCPMTCPTLTKQMAKIQEKTEGFGKSVRLYSISVDPKNDTPDILKAYGQKFGADFSRWSFLTGPLDVVESVVVNGFMSAMDGNKGSDLSKEKPSLMEITHGENFVVIDQNGLIRAFRHAQTEREVKDMVRIVTHLVREPQTNGKKISMK